jgi:hypothetical protein
MPKRACRFFLSFLCVFLISHSITYAQTIDGQVVDKQTELAIPGVTVKLLKAGRATQTTAQGYFEFNADSTRTDTLSFTSIGYKPYKLVVTGGQRQLFITLERSVTSLNQVDVNGKKAKDQILGRFLWADLKEVNAQAYQHATYPAFARSGLAKLFEAPKPNALLVNIMFGRRPLTSASSSDGKIARFYIHLCAVDPETQQPGKILLTKEIVLLDNSLKITLDLSKEKFIIPGTKFFITIEWIRIPLNEIIAKSTAEQMQRARLDSRTYTQYISRYWIFYRPILIRYPTTEPKAIKYIKQDDKWVAVNDPYTELALSATIRY